jgi:tRNA dimethylallyltransferase
MSKILVILGPTAVGKTDLALYLAKKIGGELIAGDSRQVYRGLDIGTGKLPSWKVEDRRWKIEKEDGRWKMDGVKVWMYDVADPKTQYSVKDYIETAGKVIDKISGEGKLPIIVGGTGLYIKGLLFGIDNLEVPVDKKLRDRLSKLGVEELQNILRKASPTLFESLNNSDLHNSRRLIRKIELVSMNPYIHTRHQTSDIRHQTFEALLIGLTAPRAVLNSLIDSRLDFRFQSGLVDEAKDLNRGGLSLKRLRELGLEYGVLADFIDDSGQARMTREECFKKLKLVNHQYAKRQMTFFKKMENINWFDITAENYLSQIGKLVEDWYNS